MRRKPIRARGRRRKITVRRARSKEYMLRLYVSGTSFRSVCAIANVKRICEKYLHGRYSLEVIDVYQRPEFTRTEQIIAAPTLVKSHPLPVKRWIGDMTNTERILAGLNPPPEVMA